MVSDKVKYVAVQWSDIDRWVAIIVDNINRASFRPDTVIGVTRGGWIPARLVCDHMVIKDLYAIKTEHWGMTATPDGKAKIVGEMPVDVHGKKVLVVDDITDTGESMSLLLSYIRKHEPSELKSATLLHISHSKLIPDFYGEYVNKDRWSWFIFPWNYTEDVSNIIDEYVKGGMDAASIKDRLAEEHNISFDISVVERAFSIAKGKLQTNSL